ncbi:MAG: nuclear transport factor 2 family protein [Actinomycetota bacterium]
MSHEAALDRVFDAVQAGDWSSWRSEFADDAVLGQNVAPDISVDDAVKMMPLMFADGTTVRYENVRRVSGHDSVTEMHDAVFTRPDGRVARIDVCVVMQFDDQGKIVRGDEYLDSVAAAALRD